MSDAYNLAVLYPKIVKEWHPFKNGALTPYQVTPGNRRKIWWICERGHEWSASVGNRVKGSGCPYCIGRRASETYNFAIINPIIANEWHPTKNGDLLPNEVTPGSNRKVWWKCERNHEWQASVGGRTRGTGCPTCYQSIRGQFARKAAIRKRGSLQDKYPDVAKAWHPTKNGDLSPSDVPPRTNQKVWWMCSRGHEWIQTIHNRTRGSGCPDCYAENRGDIIRKALLKKRGSLAKHYPALIDEWHPTKNGDLTPNDVTSRNNMKIWWICENGHEYETMVANRTGGPNRKGSGCPFCYRDRRRK